MSLRLDESFAPPAVVSPLERRRVLLTGYGRGDRALALALEEEGVTVWIVESLAVARQETLRLQPDVLLVGPEAELDETAAFLRDVRRDGAADCVLYLARRNDPVETSGALAAGAHDVVLGPHSAAAVLVRIALHETRTRAPRAVTARRCPGGACRSTSTAGKSWSTIARWR